jgi:DNA-binding transcriptional ArsR family regulator
MPPKTERTVRRATAPDLEAGLICADRDGNRIRIDRIDIDIDIKENNADRGTGTVFYHFLNDELRVQEGIQERSIEQFLAEGWYMAARGRSL